MIRVAPTTDDVRSAVLAAAWAFVGFGAYVTAVHASGWITFDLGPILAIFAALALLNVVLARHADLWTGPAWAAWAYEGFHAAVLTVVLYFFGGMSLGIYVVVYAFLVVHTEVLRPDASVYVTANICALCYATLAALEHAGWIASGYGLQVPFTPGSRLAVVSFAAVSFNFLALYATRHGTQLRRMAARLEQMVTERTADLERTNRELATTAAALETKQAEVQSFVYTVTHDVKNPLNAIVMLTDLVLEEDGDRLGPEARGRLERVLRTAEHTEDMIRDLLGLFRATSRPEPPSWVDLGALAQATIETLRPQVEAKRVRIEVGTLPRVWGEPGKLGHLLANLLGNAVKYVPAARGAVVVSGSVDDGCVVLTVRDNGIGIDPVYHRRIFEPFGRVPAPQQRVDGDTMSGSGVGLAIVQQIVRAHGGRVWVDSAVGAGSTFHVRLPQGPPG